MAMLPNTLHAVCATGALLIIGACSMGAPSLQESRELALSVGEDGRLMVEAGAGTIRLVGDDGDTIRVLAEIYQRSANDDYRLVLEADGETGARLLAEIESPAFGSNDYIDLSVRVPRSMHVSINDGSGSIGVSDLDGELEIVDGSGSLTIASIGGNVTVEDGSGSVSVEGVGGDVLIDDGSGSITVTNVAGTVRISDGSGSITVRDAGDFELLDDGSGSVTLEGIRRQEEAR